MQKIAGDREFKAGLRHPTTGKPAVNGNLFFKSGKDKAARKERDGLRLSFAVPKIRCGASSPTAPTAVELWKTFTFYFSGNLV